MITILFALVLQNETTIGKLKFQPPKDWKVNKVDKTVTLAPPDEKHLLVLIPEGETAKGELKDYSEKMWKQLSEGAKKMTEGQTIAGKTEAGWDSLMTERAIEMEEGQAYAIVVVFRAADRFEALLIASDSQERVMKHQQAISALMKSLKRVVEAAKIRYFTGFYSGLQFVGGQGQKFTTTPRYLVLLDDGTFVTGFCATGYDQYDFKSEHKSFTGTYASDKETLTLTYAQGSVRKFKWNVETYDLKHAEESEGYWQEPPVEDLKLDGAYARKDSPGVTFKPDGTFVDEGGLGWIGIGLADDMKKPGRGKYRTAHFSLIVTYEDGRERRILLTVGKDQAGEKNPKKIFLGSYVHERQ
jgi:hypothetical protein